VRQAAYRTCHIGRVLTVVDAPPTRVIRYPYVPGLGQGHAGENGRF
jgi:hypothetical protein